MADLSNLGHELVGNKYGSIPAHSIVLPPRPQYEQQYDPNNDFAIFGIGDKSRGGLQTMQEKMNLADDASDK